MISECTREDINKYLNAIDGDADGPTPGPVGHGQHLNGPTALALLELRVANARILLADLEALRPVVAAAAPGSRLERSLARMLGGNVVL